MQPVAKPLHTDLDEIDFKIVKFLQENARTPFTQIATELGVTERTVRMRVQQMQTEGILSLVGVVNPVKVGLRVQTLVLISAETNKLNGVIEALKKIDEVRYMVLTSGEYQLFIEILTKDYDELSEFLMKRLNCIDGIRSTNVINELKVLKSKFNFVR